mgnify:CR=1 FL=1
MEDVAGRMARAPKGAGLGVGLLGALGAAAYGLYQSVFTGKRLFNAPIDIEIIPVKIILL